MMSASPPLRALVEAMGSLSNVFSLEPTVLVDESASLSSLVPVLKTGESGLESKLYVVDRTRTVFCHDELGKSANVISCRILVGAGVILGTVNEAHNVGILLNRSRLAEVAELRTLSFIAGA